MSTFYAHVLYHHAAVFSICFTRMCNITMLLSFQYILTRMCTHTMLLTSMNMRFHTMSKFYAHVLHHHAAAISIYFYAHVYSHHAAYINEHAFSYHVDVLTRMCTHTMLPSCMNMGFHTMSMF